MSISIDCHDRRQSTLEALVSWAREHLQWPVEEAFARVMRATFADATRTCTAAALLTQNGYGPEALKLGRSLLEATIVAHWMVHCADRKWVLDRMETHQAYNNVVWLERLQRHSWPTPDYPDEEIARIQADRDRLRKLYGKYGELPWWAAEVAQNKNGTWKQTKKRSLDSLVDDLCKVAELEGKVWKRERDDDNGEPKLTSALQVMLEIPQRLNNQLMHHSPSGLVSFVELRDGQLVVEDGPSDDWVPQAQQFLYISYSHLVGLLIRTYRPELEVDFERMFDPMFHRAFVSLTDEELAWAKNHRNEPCPCGSGVKSKKCHLAEV